jgi:hypothetical protein
MVNWFSEAEPSLSRSSSEVLKIIRERWPVNPLEVAKELGKAGGQKTLSARYLYHFKKLRSLELIHIKKLGNTYIAWPMDVEKIRFMHEMLR